MKITTLWVGKGKVAWADAACTEYTRRLPRHLSYTDQRLNPIPYKGNELSVKDSEAKRILDKIGDGDRLVAIDERGADLDSHQFAALIDSATKLGTRRLVFAIGGPYGHGKAVQKEAWKTVRLSAMVLNHSIARIALSEQIYRASTLLWGGQYHH